MTTCIGDSGKLKVFLTIGPICIIMISTLTLSVFPVAVFLETLLHDSNEKDLFTLLHSWNLNKILVWDF